MICLSKNLADKYINTFAKGSNLQIQDYNEPIPDSTIMIRSIMKRELIKDRWDNKKPFYYMDSGYFGNFKWTQNPNGLKFWHRIVPNALQHNKIIERPDDRWKQFGMDIKVNRLGGRHILLVLPSEKPCKFYDIDLDQWTKDTINEIKKYTDRPIKIRAKANRSERLQNTIYKDLEHCHAMVTYQSIAAVESVIAGVPAFTLAPTAADPVCDQDLSKIENPTIQHKDKLHAWAHHLAYGQYHTREFKNGQAYKMLMKDREKCE